MTMARQTIVDESTEGVYHCTARCVRRAFLCGQDAYTGKDFNHRKAWVRNRLKTLIKAFGLDVYAYAVMSNHLHVVVRNRPDIARTWSPESVARRWLKVFPKRRRPDGHPAKPNDFEISAILQNEHRVAELRSRLCSISWFMKSLNEFIARRANKEDGCKGRFWEGRFKCQRLLDEAAMLTCMTYVDLNAIRARIVESLTAPQFTSAFERIQARQARQRLRNLKAKTEASTKSNKPQHGKTPTLTKRQQTLQNKEKKKIRRAAWLSKFNAKDSPLPNVTERHYLELLDWTGRQLRADKPGAIPTNLAPLLTQLDINTENWTKTIDRYGSLFYHIAGHTENMLKHANHLGHRWLKGITASRQLFCPSPNAPNPTTTPTSDKPTSPANPIPT